MEEQQRYGAINFNT